MHRQRTKHRPSRLPVTVEIIPPGMEQSMPMWPPTAGRPPHLHMSETFGNRHSIPRLPMPGAYHRFPPTDVGFVRDANQWPPVPCHVPSRTIPDVEIERSDSGCSDLQSIPPYMQIPPPRSPPFGQDVGHPRGHYLPEAIAHREIGPLRAPTRQSQMHISRAEAYFTRQRLHPNHNIRRQDMDSPQKPRGSLIADSNEIGPPEYSQNEGEGEPSNQIVKFRGQTRQRSEREMPEYSDNSSPGWRSEYSDHGYPGSSSPFPYPQRGFQNHGPTFAPRMPAHPHYYPQQARGRAQPAHINSRYYRERNEMYWKQHGTESDEAGYLSSGYRGDSDRDLDFSDSDGYLTDESYGYSSYDSA